MVVYIRPRSRSVAISETDDSSVTSTVSVDRSSQKALPLQLRDGSATSTARRVRFDLSATETHETRYCKEDRAELWYKAVEYKHFRRSTVSAARALAQTEAKNRAAFSYERVMERTYQICKDVINEGTESYQSLSTPQERRHLNRWAEVAPNRLGLEKWALRHIVKDKQQRRFEMIDLILDLQDAKEYVEGDRAEFIRKSCERISRPSRLYAQALAKAQANANATCKFTPEFFS